MLVASEKLERSAHLPTLALCQGFCCGPDHVCEEGSVMKVMVLGSGPAGLMAAQGVFDAHSHNYDGDLQLALISYAVKSPLYGAQYLHEPIPGSPVTESRAISYRLTGSADDYRRKVYGNNWGGTVSPEDLEQDHTAWDIRATYDWLWEKWESAITESHVDPVALASVVNSPERPDLIISSIPKPSICHAGHTFGAMEVWAAGDAPELGIKIPYNCPMDMVVCNGEPSPAWYRMSNVFGRTTVEWPGKIPVVPVRTASRVQKPTYNDCNCWADSPVPVVFVGRYGTWEKGVLSHTAYKTAYKEIDRRLTGATEEG